MDFARYVTLRSEKFGAVIFDTLNEKVYVTNQTGKDILNLMADGLGLDEIAGRLGQGCDQAPSSIRRDVADFVGGLRAAGLLASGQGDEA